MRFPAVSVVHFLECSGNSLSEFTKPAATVQTSHGLLSCVEWTGVRLSTLLDAVGVKPEGNWILAEGRRCRGHDAIGSDGEGARRCPDRFWPERRGAFGRSKATRCG